jgi:hypothetical protein
MIFRAGGSTTLAKISLLSGQQTCFSARKNTSIFLFFFVHVISPIDDSGQQETRFPITV